MKIKNTLKGPLILRTYKNRILFFSQETRTVPVEFGDMAQKALKMGLAQNA